MNTSVLDKSQCLLMCSDDEVAFRKKVFDIHPLECTTTSRNLSRELRVCDRYNSFNFTILTKRL